MIVVRRPLGRWLLLGVAAALLSAACTTSGGAEEPRDGRAGLQLSGRVDVGSLAVSDGRPELLEGDCEARAQVPADVCVSARAVGGERVVLGLANMGQLPGGERVEVVDTPCRDADGCAEIDDGAVVWVRLGDQLHRAEGGSLLVRQSAVGARHVAQLRVDVAGGSVSGELDAVPRPDPEADDAEPEREGPGPGEAFTPDEVEPYDPDEG